MQILELNVINDRFYCPVTGEVIFDLDGTHFPKSVMGFWINECLEDAEIFNKELEEAFSQHLNKPELEDTDYEDDFIAFLENLDINPYWVAFRIPDSVIAGPTIYYVIDLSTEMDE